MIENINENGQLTKTKAPISWYLTNINTLKSWSIVLPTTDKYLKYELVLKTSKKIRICRKIMVYTSPIIILCGFILLMTVD